MANGVSRLRIQKIRTEKGVSQAALAHAAGVTQGYISHLEVGRCENPSLKVLERISKCLGVTVKELLGEHEKKAV